MKRIILKIGTSTLTQGTERISRGKIEDIAAQLQSLKSTHEVILVSSGAIAAARQHVSMHGKSEMSVKQALAAIGQVHLMRFFQEVFTDFGMSVSQCLLSYHDFTNDESKKNIKNTVETLLNFDYVPVINENDTVATDEIKFGDNDKLAALTAVLLKADLLVLATDTDGLYNADPKTHADATIITEVSDLDMYLSRVTDAKSTQGSGGMKSKLVAAQIAQGAGIETWILNGGRPSFLHDALTNASVFTRVVGS